MMNTYPQLTLNELRLSQASRTIRLVIGTLLIAIPMMQSSTLGTLAVLPLLAVYPVLTGILGFSLMELLVVRYRRQSGHQPRRVIFARTSLFIFGTGLIAYVMGSEIAPAWLALVAIFPILMAVLGTDLVSNVLLTRRVLQASGKSIATIVQAQPTNVLIQDDAFKQHSPKQAA